MKKFLKLTAILTAILMMLSIVPVFADEGDVEISFKVGDSTLLINGTPVAVVTPYVVGEGTTLVPVRVITEAFGAKVDWDHNTQTAILEYEGTKINLQIGNKIAEVNGKAETLLAAPELTNGSTMVPLRFISETFNAVVTYDEKTEAITVVKKANAEGTTVTGNENSKNVGDSHYGWTMEKPAEMQMSVRRFDGTCTIFSYDKNNYIEIDMYATDPEYDLSEDFEAAKASAGSLTLIKAEKSSGVNVNKVHIQAKDQNYFYSEYKFTTNKYTICVSGTFTNDDTARRDGWLKTMDTFSVEYNGEDTYDLSNVKGDFRNYEAKAVSLSFDVPKDFYMTSAESSVNEFTFATMKHDDYMSDLDFVVYSKSDVKGAEALAKNDHTHNKSILSPLVATYSNIVKKEYTNFTAYEYTLTLKTSKYKGITKDIFFEIGDYVYNISVSLDSSYANPDAIIEKIINSIKTEELDPNEVGMLMRNNRDTEGTYTSESGGYKLTLPKAYQEVKASTGMNYINPAKGISIGFASNKYNPSDFSKIKDSLKNYEKAYKNEDDYEVVSAVEDTMISSRKFATLTVRETTDSGYVYTQFFANENLSFVIIYPELTYCENAIQEVRTIIGSAK